MYKMIKEIKEEIIGKDIIKRTIQINNAINNEINRVKQECMQWIVNELKPLVSAIVKREMHNITQ